jgi:hypothetical protein
MAALLKYKRTPITTPPYQVPSVDVTPDPAIFSLVTTFKQHMNITQFVKYGKKYSYLFKNVHDHVFWWRSGRVLGSRSLGWFASRLCSLVFQVMACQA